MNPLKLIAIALSVVGAVLIAAGLLAGSEATALASVDCGCGGGPACVTKAGMVDRGAALVGAGLVSFAVAGFAGSVAPRFWPCGGDRIG
jgi:hypothetical protein